MGFLDKMTKKLNDKLNETPPKGASYKSGSEQFQKHGSSRSMTYMVKCASCKRTVVSHQTGQGLCFECI